VERPGVGALSRKETDMPYAELAALGALGVSVGVLLLWALLVYITLPRDNGVDWTHAVLTWLSTGVVALALIAAHLTYARILFDVARGRG
jgi:hypothetical protein